MGNLGPEGVKATIPQQNLVGKPLSLYRDTGICQETMFEYTDNVQRASWLMCLRNGKYLLCQSDQISEAGYYCCDCGH